MQDRVGRSEQLGGQVLTILPGGAVQITPSLRDGAKVRDPDHFLVVEKVGR